MDELTHGDQRTREEDQAQNPKWKEAKLMKEPEKWRRKNEEGTSVSVFLDTSNRTS